jgi:hypothetical protein
MAPGENIENNESLSESYQWRRNLRGEAAKKW